MPNLIEFSGCRTTELADQNGSLGAILQVWFVDFVSNARFRV